MLNSSTKSIYSSLIKGFALNKSHGRFYATLVQTGTKKPVEKSSSVKSSSEPKTITKQEPKTIPAHLVTDAGAVLEYKSVTSKSGRIYDEEDFTPGLQAFVSKSKMLTRLLMDDNSESKQFTKLEHDTDASLHTLLIRSVTHASFGTGKVRTQDRLAFIGSHVLDLVLTEIISDKYMPRIKYGTESEVEYSNAGRESMRTVHLVKAIYSNKSFLPFIVANQYWDLSGIASDKKIPNDMKRLHQTSIKYPSKNDPTIIHENEHYTIRAVGWNEMSAKSQRQILSNAIYGIIGSIFSKNGLKAAREFVEQEILKERPSEVFRKLLHLDDPQTVLNDIIQAQYQTSVRFVEEFDKQNNCFKCSLFLKSQIIGEANAKDSIKARKLACFDGMMRLQTMVPNH